MVSAVSASPRLPPIYRTCSCRLVGVVWFFIVKLAALFLAAKDSFVAGWRGGLAAVGTIIAVNVAGLGLFVTAADGWIAVAARSWPFCLVTAAVGLVACRCGFRAAGSERVDLTRSQTLERAALGFLGAGLLDLATGLVIAGAVAAAGAQP